MKKLTMLATALALLALPLAACGGDDETTSAQTTEETTSGPPAETVDVSAAPDNSFAYEQKTLATKAGESTFAFNNPAQISHDFCIEDEGGDEVGCSDLIAEGESELDVSLASGDYTFYCSVAGHRDGGMEGTLTVD